MAGSISKGKTFTTNEEVTATKLHTLVDSATMADIDQTNLASNYGLVERGASTPTDTDAFHYDTTNKRARVYDGSAWPEIVDTTVLGNNTTDDMNGLLDGLWIERNNLTTLKVYGGAVAIGNKIYYGASKTVTFGDAWASDGANGGKDSSTTISTGNWYYIFVTPTTNNPQDWQILVCDDTSPSDATVGTDARLIGYMYYTTTDSVGPQMIHNIRPEGVYGWNYQIGDGSGPTATDTVTYGVTFAGGGPNVYAQAMGDKSTTDLPTDVGDFSIESAVVSLSGITTTSFQAHIWIVSNGNTNASKYYGYTWFAKGRWAI